MDSKLDYANTCSGCEYLSRWISAGEDDIRLYCNFFKLYLTKENGYGNGCAWYKGIKGVEQE